jgi:hypothetical protein
MSVAEPFEKRYEIYSAVFLFKAHAFGAISNESHRHSTALVRTFIFRLKAAATGEQHIAYRYSKLLSSQWFKDASPIPQTNLASQGPANSPKSMCSAPQGSQSHTTACTSFSRETENSIFEELGLDASLIETVPDNTFSFSDSDLSIPAPNPLQSLSFPEIDLPGLNGAELSSLVALDSCWPY